MEEQGHHQQLNSEQQAPQQLVLQAGWGPENEVRNISGFALNTYNSFSSGKVIKVDLNINISINISYGYLYLFSSNFFGF